MTFRNALVRRLNDAIVGLYLGHHDVQAVRALYDRWNTFVRSVAHRSAPNDRSLLSVYREFSGAYVALAHALGVKNVDQALASIATRKSSLGSLERAVFALNLRRGHELSGPGETAAEQLNNAIVALDFAMPSTPPGRKKAVADLAVHWLDFWNGSARTWTPPIALAAKLQRYAEWYARCWALADTSTRSRVPAPTSIDVSNMKAIEDQIHVMSEGLQATANALVNAGAGVSEAVLEAIEEGGKRAGHGVAWALTPLAVLIVAVLLSFGFARSAR